MRPLVVVALLVALSSSCAKPSGTASIPSSPPPVTPQPIAPSPAPSPAPSSPPSPSVATPASAGASASALASAAASPTSPPTIPASWTHHANASLHVSFAYPSSTFHLTETADAIHLDSALQRELLGGDPKPGMWTYSILMARRPGTRRAVLARELPSYMDLLFPDGGAFAADPDLASDTTLAGRPAYEVRTGVEGYNQDTFFVELDSSTSMIMRCQYVGDVMGPKPDAEEQVRTCEGVFQSIVWR
jgi:hypothetical protein